ncbi:hypothetical protein [Sphingobium yanoikuyae]|uniref:hypothetical protein n=1 Tax=Sphingobium yanoikuyae TaxID=13690 RepID=UPI000F7EA09E|nr:hypothetical protein [Sphingobium yanoikuyae]
MKLMDRRVGNRRALSISKLSVDARKRRLDAFDRQLAEKRYDRVDDRGLFRWVPVFHDGDPFTFT